MEILYYQSTNSLELVGLTRDDTDALVSDATVTATVKTVSPEAAVSGLSDLPLAAVVGSAGTYRGTVPHDAALSLGIPYLVDVLAVVSGVGRLQMRESLIVRRYEG